MDPRVNGFVFLQRIPLFVALVIHKNLPLAVIENFRNKLFFLCKIHISQLQAIIALPCSIKGRGKTRYRYVVDLAKCSLRQCAVVTLTEECCPVGRCAL